MTVPKMVVQEIYDFGGSYPDNVIYPEEGSLKFRAWIVGRPDYVLTDELPHCYIDMEGTYYNVRFNLGNFPGLAKAPVDWSIGETVRIEITQPSTGRIASTEFVIESGSSAQVRKRELAIALQDPPKPAKGKKRAK